MQVIKHIGLFWKDYIMVKRCQLFLLLLIDNKLESDFKIKASYFNSFFASKYTSLINNSTVSNSLQYVPTAWLSSFSFNEEVISNTINALNISKGNGYDDISIQMIRLWSKSVVKHFFIIFKYNINNLIIWLLSITWSRGILLYISKAFDRVWHKGLICKIRSTGTSGTPLKTYYKAVKWYISRCFLNGRTPSSSPILAGVPQGSILGPLLSNIHKWSRQQYLINCKTIYWWHIYFLYCSWYWLVF